MKVITAPETYVRKKRDIFCFLAGGITECWNWQKEVINELNRYENLDHLIIFNPRRDSFPTDNPEQVGFEQIAWEFRYLEFCNIFSMYFVNSPSVQPICMYELGRNVIRMESKYLLAGDWLDHLVISAEKGYKRLPDVLIQTKLAAYGNDIAKIYDDPKEAAKDHARRIVEAYRITGGYDGIKC